MRFYTPDSLSRAAQHIFHLAHERRHFSIMKACHDVLQDIHTKQCIQLSVNVIMWIRETFAQAIICAHHKRFLWVKELMWDVYNMQHIILKTGV